MQGEIECIIGIVGKLSIKVGFNGVEFEFQTKHVRDIEFE